MVRIVVVGSVNADTFIELREDRLPSPGETLLAKDDSGLCLLGGKGANQAVTIARQGGDVSFIGMFGNDANAEMAWNSMADYGVKMTGSVRLKDKPQGQAYIMLQPNGENTIIVVSGANWSWPKELSDTMKSEIKSADVVLLQCEIPTEANEMVAKYAKEQNVPVILDAGGINAPLESSFLENISILSPNEQELSLLIGGGSIETDSEELEEVDVVDAAKNLLAYGHGSVLVKLGAAGFLRIGELAEGGVNTKVLDAARKLLALGPESVLVKLGAAGSLLIGKLAESDEKVVREKAKFVPPEKVVDTTGAGDCFTASFAMNMVSGTPIREAIRSASGAAALCIQKKGTSSSFPSADEVNAYMK